MATVTKRGNSYRIMASAGRKVDGKQVRPSMTWTPEPGMTQRQIERELERQRLDFERRVEAGQSIDNSIRFSVYAQMWMERGKEGAEKPLAPKTYLRYTQLLERINAALGHLRVVDIQPNHIRSFLDNLKEEGIRETVRYRAAGDLAELIKEKGLTPTKLVVETGLADCTVRSARAGKNVSKAAAEAICKALGVKLKAVFVPLDDSGRLSDRTVLHHYRLLSSILSSAVMDDNIIQQNPAKRVRAPHCEKLEAESLDEKQAARLLELIEAEPMEYKTAVKVLLYTGARRGEVLGLQWGDVDMEGSILRIRRASQYTPDKGVFVKAPKTKSSVRSLKVPPAAISTLKAYKQWQNERRLAIGDLWQDEGWVFTGWNGKPIHPDTLSGWFGDFIKKTDLPRIHIHTLRHTNASILIASGVNVRTVSKRLGHSQTSTTTNIYSHALESADALAADALGDILSPDFGTK